MFDSAAHMFHSRQSASNPIKHFFFKFFNSLQNVFFHQILKKLYLFISYDIFFFNFKFNWEKKFLIKKWISRAKEIPIT